MKSEAAKRAQAKYAENNKERLKENNLRHRKLFPEYVLWNTAKQRAKKKNLDFNIEVTDIVFPEKCPILNIPIITKYGSHGGHDNSPSIDRIDPTKGYTKDNIQIISLKANMMKSSSSIDELRLFAYWIRNTYGD